MTIAWFTDPAVWTALLQILLLDLLLGGDNAVVIAMACRRLPPSQRRRAIWGGMAGAVVLRILLLFFAMQLLQLAWLKLAAGVLLLWIGVRLIATPEQDAHAIKGSGHLFTAIKTIVMADAVMSLDNVLAVAAAGRGNLYLVGAGVLLSIPLIVFGSRLVLALMERFPVVVTLGGGLIGWIAVGLAFSDPAMARWLPPAASLPGYLASAVGALLVMLVGAGVSRYRARQRVGPA
ncbi:TerC family protein [Pseudomonas sp. RIT-PI-S]|uniref:TerC family protein n=1 Tax=Pseudomonas sp. RIT-PI-S TaxID=3035295 RepID=UPI0021D85918|nr:TerC family protein [Pseudomonas sp. RIT-PI-S]